QPKRPILRGPGWSRGEIAPSTGLQYSMYSSCYEQHGNNAGGRFRRQYLSFLTDKWGLQTISKANCYLHRELSMNFTEQSNQNFILTNINQISESSCSKITSIF